MQLLLIRHALPNRSESGQGSDPDLSTMGLEQAGRLPAALQRYPISRIVTSPQQRAIATAGPLAAARGLDVEIDPRLAEYDRDLTEYLPVEQLRTERPEQWARMAAGLLPDGVDEAEFLGRVSDAVSDLVAAAGHDDTVAVVSHGGVINALLHRSLGTRRILSFAVDYTSVTRLYYSRSGNPAVIAVNTTEHVWDLLPHRQARPAADGAGR